MKLVAKMYYKHIHVTDYHIFVIEYFEKGKNLFLTKLQHKSSPVNQENEM